MPTQNNAIHLSSRAFLHVGGDDAESFLQNVITNNMDLLRDRGIIYTCLLSPQGQVLNEFFVLKKDDGFIIDIDRGQMDALKRRFTFFRLRSKVSFTAMDSLKVYASADGLPDPRHPDIGGRLYTEDVIDGAGDEEGYIETCIAMGVPCGFSTIHAERDVVADANLDLLNAVAWDKGCFIGQEVVARMYHRNLSRKRMMVAEGIGLAAGQTLYQNGVAVGDVRQTNKTGEKAIALVKLTSLAAGGAAGQKLALAADGAADVTLQNPAYAQF